jgi:chromosome segregation ATPase
MAKLDDLAERVDRLVLRHQELKRTTALIAEQLVAVTSERDSLRSRLGAARSRVDALLQRLPAEPPRAEPAQAEAAQAEAGLVEAAQAGAAPAETILAAPPLALEGNGAQGAHP